MTVTVPAWIATALFSSIALAMFAVALVLAYKCLCYIVRYALVNACLWQCWRFYLRYTVHQDKTDTNRYLCRALLERDNCGGSDLGPRLRVLKSSTLESALYAKAHAKEQGGSDERK